MLKSPNNRQSEEDASVYKRWMDELDAAKKVFKDWHDRCKKILKVYKDDRKRTDAFDDINKSHKLNILWSNIQTLQPALYSQTPDPNVSRRFLDRDPTSRTAATILERNLQTAQELVDFDYVMKRVRDDYLLCARGIDWVRFAPEMGMLPVREPVTQIQLEGTGQSVFRPVRGGDEIPPDRIKQDEEGYYFETDPEEQILAYGLALDHVVWSDFLHEPLNDWAKVTWGAKRVLMKRPQLIKSFGKEVAVKIKLNKTFNGKEADDNSSDERKKADCAEVWEIWDKSRREVIWITDGYQDGPIKRLKDPLRLTGFFPFPRPLFGTLTTDSLIPVPDYALYQDQAQQIDTLTDRIRLLIKALRVVGLYNAESADLSRLLSETDENEMLPVENWMAFAQSGGMKTNIDWLPIEQIQIVLTGLFNARTQLKQDLYEVTGISDIIRGATAPSETATAQQIKANFGNLRLQDRQSEMARFAKDTLRIMAEIQAEHYSPEALIEMSGVAEMDEFRVDLPDQQDPQSMMAYQAALQKQQQMFGKAISLLKSDRLRTFRVDIETDATVAPDQQKEKEARVEFLTAVSPFLEKSAQVGAMAPQLVPLLMKMLEFGVRGFRAGRTLESAIEETIALAEAMQKQAQEAPPQAPPDPKAQAEAQKLDAEVQKLNAELQALQEKTQAEAQKAQADAASAKAQADARLLDIQARSNEARQKFQQEMLKLTNEIEFRRSENELKIAELNASLELKRMQLQQAEAGSQSQKPTEADDPNEAARTVSERAKFKAEYKKAQFEIQKMDLALAELKKRADAMGGVQEALNGAMSPDDVLGINQKPKEETKPQAPSERAVEFIRDENGSLVGGKIRG